MEEVHSRRKGPLLVGTRETGTILDQIVADKREELGLSGGGLMSSTTLHNRLVSIEHDPSILGAQWRLRNAIGLGPRTLTSTGQRICLIAEIKVASPSKGRLIGSTRGKRWLYDIVDAYTGGGACGISVLTERKYFSGRLEHMLSVRLRVKSLYPTYRPSILRKDFIFEKSQIYEARVYGADTVLLIVAILEEELLKDLIITAQSIAMDALVEVHNEEELEMALRAGAEIIGINNRDLRTFEVDLSTTERLRPEVPSDRLVVSESGIHTRGDVERLAQCSVDAMMVGESLVTAPDIHAKMRELLI